MEDLVKEIGRVAIRLLSVSVPLTSVFDQLSDEPEAEDTDDGDVEDTDDELQAGAFVIVGDKLPEHRNRPPRR